MLEISFVYNWELYLINCEKFCLTKNLNLQKITYKEISAIITTYFVTHLNYSCKSTHFICRYWVKIIHIQKILLNYLLEISGEIELFQHFRNTRTLLLKGLKENASYSCKFSPYLFINKYDFLFCKKKYPQSIKWFLLSKD